MRFWAGLVIGIVLFPAIVVGVVYLGLLPAAANDSSMRFEPLIAEAGLFARIEREAPSRDVSSMSTKDLVAGANIYQKSCAVCHGLPGKDRTVVGGGMFPSAPHLLSPDGMVTGDSAGETYWKVKNGIRLSGMPSFAKVLSDEQTWQVTAVVKRADKLPAEVMNALEPQP
jgi:thiosulfate dehydrogenase